MGDLRGWTEIIMREPSSRPTPEQRLRTDMYGYVGALATLLNLHPELRDEAINLLTDMLEKQ